MALPRGVCLKDIHDGRFKISEDDPRVDGKWTSEARASIMDNGKLPLITRTLVKLLETDAEPGVMHYSSGEGSQSGIKIDVTEAIGRIVPVIRRLISGEDDSSEDSGIRERKMLTRIVRSVTVGLRPFESKIHELFHVMLPQDRDIHIEFAQEIHNREEKEMISSSACKRPRRVCVQPQMGICIYFTPDAVPEVRFDFDDARGNTVAAVYGHPQPNEAICVSHLNMRFKRIRITLRNTGEKEASASVVVWDAKPVYAEWKL